VLVTTVDIGEDQSDQIELHEGDSPEVRNLAAVSPPIADAGPCT
jgi:hypothetical protein